jgi:hypothetical protein
MGIMARSRRLVLAVALLALSASPAGADAIRYTTTAFDSPNVHFEGVSGTFEPGEIIPLGRFVIDAPPPGSSITFDNEPFAIALKAPDFDRPVPAGPDTAPYPTTVESSVLIRGHLSGVLRDGAPGLVATYDSVQLGGLGPYLLGHIQQFTFPIPVGDIQLPPAQLLVIPTDGWVDGQPRVVEIKAQVVPEPAAWVVWGLVGVGGWVARRCRPTVGGESPE